jgi:hypothetical protein
MITSQMKADLAAMGFSREQIKNITPAEAHVQLRTPWGIWWERGMQNEGRSAVGIPFMITRQMKADLAARGFTREQIWKMTPAEAHVELRTAWGKNWQNARSTDFQPSSVETEIRQSTTARADWKQALQEQLVSLTRGARADYCSNSSVRSAWESNNSGDFLANLKYDLALLLCDLLLYPTYYEGPSYVEGNSTASFDAVLGAITSGFAAADFPTRIDPYGEERDTALGALATLCDARGGDWPEFAKSVKLVLTMSTQRETYLRQLLSILAIGMAAFDDETRSMWPSELGLASFAALLVEEVAIRPSYLSGLAAEVAAQVSALDFGGHNTSRGLTEFVEAFRDDSDTRTDSEATSDRLARVNSLLDLAKTVMDDFAKPAIDGGQLKFAIIAEIPGTIRFGRDYKNFQRIIIEPADPEDDPREYLIPKGTHIHFHEGDLVEKGAFITEGNPAPIDILLIRGVEALGDNLVLDPAIVELIKLAQERGSVSIDQISALLPPLEVTSEEIKNVLAMFSQMGITVVEAEEDCDIAPTATSSDSGLIPADFDDAVLELFSGEHCSGADLRALVEDARVIRNVLNGLHSRYNRQVVEQATIAGLLHSSIFSDPEKAKVAAPYIARRLDILAEEFERGWTGDFTEGRGFEFERTARCQGSCNHRSGAPWLGGCAQARRIYRAAPAGLQAASDAACQRRGEAHLWAGRIVRRNHRRRTEERLGRAWWRVRAGCAQGKPRAGTE